MPLKQAIAQVINGRDLSFAEAEAAMDAIMDGAASPAQSPVSSVRAAAALSSTTSRRGPMAWRMAGWWWTA